MTATGIGNSTRLNYDECSYKKQLNESVSPGNYKLSIDQTENVNRCRGKNDAIHFKYEFVDAETDLLNIMRLNSHCDELKYNATDPAQIASVAAIPKSFPPELCPIVQTNIPKTTDKGFTLTMANMVL